MPPRVIADSDDESDAEERFSPPPPPPAPGVAHSNLTRSSDHESLATASTDSAYFQKIYNDQREAARERSRDARAAGSGALKDDAHHSSHAAIAEVAEHGTVRESHKSSGTSTTEPNVERFGDMFPQENWGTETQATTQGEGVDDRQIESAADPWGVPSDSETPRQLKVRKSNKAEKRRLESTQRDATTQSCVGLDNTETSIEDQDNTDYPDSKRRRLQKQKQPLTLASDSVSHGVDDSVEFLEASVGMQADRATAFSIPVPGLPVRGDASFQTPMQKKSITIQDSTMDEASTSSVKRRSLLPQQKTLYSAGSSSSRTNFNSPRNLPISISSDHFESLESPVVVKSVVTKTREYGSIGTEVHSSPDAIALEIAEEPVKRALEPGHSDREDAPIPNGDPPELQQGREDIEFESTERVVEEPAPKRRRGRPKKTENIGEPISDRERDVDLFIDAEPAHGAPKKKRGRPRKQPPPESPDRSRLETAASSPRVDVPEVILISDEDEEAGPVIDNDNQNFYIEVKKAQEVPSNQGDSEPPEEEELGHGHAHKDDQTSEASDKQGKDGQEADTPGLRRKRKHEPRQKELANDDTPNANTGQAPQPVMVTTDKENMRTASPASTSTKPKYRVGLSKRSKIAPLLKSVRK